jgi:predicted dehydrogenase
VTAVRIAVIGAGLIGRKHIEVLRNGGAAYALAGVCDPSPAAAAEAATLGYAIHATIEELLDREKPEAAVIAVPNQLHKSASLACIERGIHVLVEKPIADSLASALAIVDAAAARKVGVLVGHHRRHNPLMRKAQEIVQGGGVGQVVAVNGMWLSHKPRPYFDVAWRREPGGGPILINAIHDIDCMRMLCGDVATVQAMSANAARGFAVEDTAAAVLRFKNGALGTLVVSDSASAPWSWEWTSRENPLRPFEPESCFLVAGTRGSLAVPSLQHRWHEPGREDWNVELVQKRVHVALEDAYYAQALNLAQVARGSATPVLDAMGGTRTLATTLAITESARTGAPVDVDALLGRA